MKEKEFEDFLRKIKRMNLLNSKINLILPELMSRNKKLVERLKNKLKVSSFFNNIENRNKKYFQDFIFSSDKRAKDLKTGLEINRAIKQGSKSMSLLFHQMSEDIILKNANILIREKKLISENTEQETHTKINELLQNLKSTIKSPYGKKFKTGKKITKSLSQNEIKDATVFIGEKIKKEEKQIQEKINKYLEKMHNSLDKYDNERKTDKNGNNNNNSSDEDESFRKKNIKRKKEFNRYADNIYIKDKIKFINYTKPKPFQLKDKESATLKRIKNYLCPPTTEKLLKFQNIKEDEEESDNTSFQSKTNLNFNKTKGVFNKIKTYSLNRNSSMTNISSNINLNINKLQSQETKNNKDFFEELGNFDAKGKDTIEILNNLADESKYLTQRMERKFEKINSLIDVDLPYTASYELLLNYFKNPGDTKINQKYFSFYPKSNKNIKISSLKKDNKILPELTPKIRQTLSFLKDEIENFKNINIEQNSIFNPLFKIYLGSKTTKHKNGLINMNNNMINQKLTYKNSMDNIFEKKGKNDYITLKNLLEGPKKNDILKRVNSMDIIK